MRIAIIWRQSPLYCKESLLLILFLQFYTMFLPDLRLFDDDSIRVHRNGKLDSLLNYNLMNYFNVRSVWPLIALWYILFYFITICRYFYSPFTLLSAPGRHLDIMKTLMGTERPNFG